MSTADPQLQEGCADEAAPSPPPPAAQPSADDAASDPVSSPVSEVAAAVAAPVSALLRAVEEKGLRSGGTAAASTPSSGDEGAARSDARTAEMADVLTAYSAEGAGGCPAAEDLSFLVELCKEDGWHGVRSLLLHTLSAACAAVPPDAAADFPLAAASEAILGNLHGGCLKAAAQAQGSLLMCHSSLADAASTPIMGELLQALEAAGDKTSADLLPLLMLANALLDAAAQQHGAPSAHIPDAVAGSVAAALEAVQGGPEEHEALLLAARLKGKEAAPPPAPDAAAAVPAEAAAPQERSYTESEVKAFLYQRKLEWDGQIRKRDKTITALSSQVQDGHRHKDRLDAELRQATAQAEERAAAVERLERQAQETHQKNLDAESKLEDTIIFLKEREYVHVSAGEFLFKYALILGFQESISTRKTPIHAGIN